MTVGKRPGEPVASAVERQIREAEERGLFDDLPGKGKPLRNLGKAYDPLWWVKEWVARERISLLPRSLEVRRRVEKVREEIRGMRAESDVRAALEALNREIARANATSVQGPPTAIARVDIDAVAAAWRRERAGSD